MTVPNGTVKMNMLGNPTKKLIRLTLCMTYRLQNNPF